MIADPRVQGVSLTGSERAGAAVAEIAGRHLKKVVLELGGSDPFVVLSADDLDSVVEAAVAARLDNTGQACNAAKRFIVHTTLHDAFVEKFTARLLAAQTGAPLSSEAAAETLGRQVDEAVAQGATLHTEGRREGARFPAGVLTGLTTDLPAARQELFGPVAMVFPATDEDDAVRIANDTPYGLGSYVFTTDADQARRVADRIEAAWSSSTASARRAPSSPSAASSAPASAASWAGRASRSSSTRSSSAPSPERNGPAVATHASVSRPVQPQRGPLPVVSVRLTLHHHPPGSFTGSWRPVLPGHGPAHSLDGVGLVQ